MRKTALLIPVLFALVSMQASADFLSLCRTGTPEQVKKALDSGADPNEADFYGITPLMSAAINGNEKVIELLLAAGASVKAMNEEMHTALIVAAENNPNMAVIIALLKAGASVKDRDMTRRTPMVAAAANNPNPEIIPVLMEAGASIDEADQWDITALMYAAAHNPNPDMILALLEAGADAWARSSTGMTALDYALKNSALKGTAALEELKKAAGK